MADLADLADRDGIEKLFAAEEPDRVVNLAAQAGVRYGSINPYSYGASNLTGFLHILEGFRQHDVEHLVYASSSSVYGADSYAPLYQLPVTGFVFSRFTDRGGVPICPHFYSRENLLPVNRLTSSITSEHSRYFTYINDTVDGVLRTLDHVATPDPDWQSDHPSPATSSAPYRLYKIGNNQPVELLDYVACIEKADGKSAITDMLPQQPGDVRDTFADIDALVRDVS